jgi:hypothetical protein
MTVNKNYYCYCYYFFVVAVVVVGSSGGGGSSKFNIGKLLSYCPQNVLDFAAMTFEFIHSALSHILSTCTAFQYLPFKNLKITISAGSHYSFFPQPHIHVFYSILPKFWN